MVELMSPWDSMEWFDTPRETFFTGPVANGTKIAGVNPNRIALVISICPPAVFTITTNPAALANNGICLTTSFPVIILTQKDHGPLAQMAWYSATSPTSGITVIEVVLREWPKGRDGGQ